jgi:DNA-binding NarL/FixJ family response regulator
MITRVAVVEDNLGFLDKFVNIIASAPEFQLSGTAVDGKGGFDLIERDAADIYLVDLGLPDFNGTEVIRKAVQTHPHCTVMVVSVFADDASILASIEAGATGYILKDGSSEEILDCLRNLRDGGARVSPSIARKILQRLRVELKPPSPAAQKTLAPVEESNSLTRREIELLQSLAKGLSYNEIARLKFISPHTVAQHVRNIYRKLTVNSRGEAVYAASRMGLIE